MSDRYIHSYVGSGLFGKWFDVKEFESASMKRWLEIEGNNV